MNKLKSFIVRYNGQFIRVYEESEANVEIAKLIKKLVEQATLRVWAEIQLRHNKYKRCLAMAKICEDKLGTVVKPGWWDKWRKRWLKLAEKFKEAK